jgi:tripartite-type tricarboxylate transporter receptor subunit TctC
MILLAKSFPQTDTFMSSWIQVDMDINDESPPWSFKLIAMEMLSEDVPTLHRIQRTPETKNLFEMTFIMCLDLLALDILHNDLHLNNVLVANNNFLPNNTAELISLAKQQPGKIMIGSAGNGTVNHLVGEMLNKASGIELVHVPYKGASAAVTDLVGGQVQVSVQSLPSSISFIRSGRIKVLGVVNEKRLAALPNSSPIQETVAGLSVTPWYGLFAPVGTPKQVLIQLQTLINQALESGEFKEKLANLGAEPYQLSGDKFTALIRSELPRWAKAVKDSGASID